MRHASEWILEDSHPLKEFMERDVLSDIVNAYRRIPHGIRATWSGGSLTSHLALAEIIAGGGVRSLIYYASGRRIGNSIFDHLFVPGSK